MSTLPPRTIHNLFDLFRFRCRQQPNELAYALIREDLGLEHHLTYSQLERTVCSLAGRLTQEVSPGARVLLLYSQGIDAACAFWACACAGLVPVPTPAPDPSRGKAGLLRLRSVIQDAQVSLALTTADIAALASELSLVNETGPIKWIATEPSFNSVDSGELPRPQRTTLAYLQYTSGSTASSWRHDHPGERALALSGRESGWRNDER